jgi:endonuclease/exonuclease/phosphatase family metal-dependent hydrolase
MPGFEKPDFAYNYNPDSQIAALRSYRDTATGRALPAKAPGRLLVASWNIANLGVHERRDRDHRLIAEMISWFDLVAVQEVNDDLSGLRAVQALLPPSYQVVFSDKAGNNERMCFVYDSTRVSLLEKVGEVAVPPRWKYVIRVPDSDQKFTGFDRNPYLAAFQVDGLTMVLVNVHLYFGGDTTFQHNRRFMEALATARWADLRRGSDNAYTKNIMVMGDFNMYNADWSDPIWRVLVDKGLYLVPHSTYVGGSNIRNDRAYDQVAFFPGPIKDAVEATGVFDFDGGVFSHLWDTRTRTEFMAYTQYYLSDHRILWAELTTT